MNPAPIVSGHHVRSARTKWISLEISQFQQTAFASLLLISLAFASGCGSSNGPEVVPASGTISYKGQPLTNGMVMFNPADPKVGRVDQSEIKPDGTFALSTLVPRDGAVPGSYKVSVTSFLLGTETLAKDKGTGIGGKPAIPTRYNDPTISGLYETIESGTPRTDIKLELVD